MRKISRKRMGIFRVLLILLIMVLTATGCAGYKQGFEYSLLGSSPIEFGIKSKSDTFSIDNVTFDLYYSLYYEENYEELSSYYREENFSREELFFAIYISTGDNWSKLANDMFVEDYKSIDTHHFVKEISEEEALSKDYGYKTSFLLGTTFNHKEQFTIPKEFFSKESGSVLIGIVAIQGPLEYEGYYTTACSYTTISYKIIEENVVKFFD